MDSLKDLLDSAYLCQSGEFYPEIHKKNIDDLCVKYTDYDKKVIDCLYRFAIHLDTYSAELAEKMNDDQITKEEALETLEIIFYHFSDSIRNQALEDAISNP